MEAPEIIAETRRQVPGMADGEIQVEPIDKGGSERSYARLRCAGADPLIFMAYTTARPDNAAFLGVSEFLAELGVHVPRIVAKDLDRRLLWIEDLGADDLWAHREDPWEPRRNLYRQALEEVAKLHHHGAASIELQPPFDEGLYRWEQEYFVEQYLRRFSQSSDEEVDAVLGGAELRALREGLTALPRFLVHRDFQSENVMVRGGEVFLIDYQGLRLGRPEYDVASLLYDPYVDMADGERAELLQFYYELSRPSESFGEWQEIYYRCAAQRLMQALGAYGFLGVGKGKKEFLGHIPVARGRLVEVMSRAGGLDGVIAVLGG
ncbi:MAG: aminoglycoside phosphotransferase family protein [Verrucomicrobiales bacterium]